jgi:hypothetical protein
MATKHPRINEVTLLSTAFIRWGLGLFIFGLIVGYAPLMHYLHSALVKMGEKSLPNAALWLGSPYAVQIGALGMVSIGAVYALSLRLSLATTGRCGYASPDSQRFS